MAEPWRLAVCAAAAGWLGVPWHHRARVPGVGVDCGQLLIAAYAEPGLIASFEPARYSVDHMLHSDREDFLAIVERFMDPLPPGAAPQAADVAVYRFGRCFSHGAIVDAAGWPSIIHAFRPERRVTRGDGAAGILARERLPGGGSAPRPVRLYTARMAGGRITERAAP